LGDGGDCGADIMPASAVGRVSRVVRTRSASAQVESQCSDTDVAGLVGDPPNAGAGVRARQSVNQQENPITEFPIRREVVVQDEGIAVGELNVMRHRDDAALDRRRKYGRHGLRMTIA
jgi:hypothetical protein